MTRWFAWTAHVRCRPNGLWIVAAALVLVGSVCLVVGLGPHRHALAGPVEPATRKPPALPRTSGTVSTPTTVVIPPVAHSTPVLLSIPAIGVSVSLSSLGLNPTGTVEVPTDVQQPGWYDLGPSPGEEGSSVILGHVDTYQGPAIFYRLRTLEAGDNVDVTLADGVVTTFRVNSLTMYLKTQFPDQLVYATHGTQALNLVTCGGTFDTSTGHYLSNLVVSTTFVASTPEPASTGATTSAGTR